MSLIAPQTIPSYKLKVDTCFCFASTQRDDSSQRERQAADSAASCTSIERVDLLEQASSSPSVHAIIPLTTSPNTSLLPVLLVLPVLLLDREAIPLELGSINQSCSFLHRETSRCLSSSTFLTKVEEPENPYLKSSTSLNVLQKPLNPYHKNAAFVESSFLLDIENRVDKERSEEEKEKELT